MRSVEVVFIFVLHYNQNKTVKSGDTKECLLRPCKTQTQVLSGVLKDKQGKDIE